MTSHDVTILIHAASVKCLYFVAAATQVFIFKIIYLVFLWLNLMSNLFYLGETGLGAFNSPLWPWHRPLAAQHVSLSKFLFKHFISYSSNLLPNQNNQVEPEHHGVRMKLSQSFYKNISYGIGLRVLNSAEHIEDAKA